MKESLIAKIPLFTTLPQNEIRHLAETLRMIELAPDTVLFREGEIGDCLFIVLAGEIEVVKALETSEERVIDLCRAGEYIGEMSLLNPGGRRMAGARIRTPVQALEMTRADFDALLQRQPSLAYEMTRVLSTRLNDAHNTAIRDLQAKNRQLRRAYTKLKAAHAQIVEKEKLERELQVARQIQESILPREMPRLPGFDFGAQIIPTRAVGGDFFDFVPLDETRLGIAIADVSDKGMPAAIFMALTRSLLRAEATRVISPRRVLQNVNRLLLEMNQANMFVTVLYGVLNRATREFHYARAGHDAPLIGSARKAVLAPASKLGQPLGILPDPALDIQRIQLVRGNLLVLFTDGITEAMNAQNELFGAERLRDSISAGRGLAAQMFCDRVLADVSAFRGAAAQSDDITLVTMRVK